MEQALLLLFVCGISSLGSSKRSVKYYNARSGSSEAIWFRVFLVGCREEWTEWASGFALTWNPLWCRILLWFRTSLVWFWKRNSVLWYAELTVTKGCEYLSIHGIQESIGVLLVLDECKICGGSKMTKSPTSELWHNSDCCVQLFSSRLASLPV